MNIFVLDENPYLAARYHCDKHTPRMILESAQMLSTAVGAGYKPTHKNHPCTLWVSKSKQNAEWLIALADGLNDEYRKRYARSVDHKSMEVIKEIAWLSEALPDIGRAPFAQAMPDEYKDPDAVEAYRNYYREEKKFATWRSETPFWWMR